MTLLHNAVLSIQVGIEDFMENTPERMLSSIRNLHAGVFLLLKAKLVELSPSESEEVLLKQRIAPRRHVSGKIDFVGSGSHTAGTQEIQQRLKDLEIQVDWRRIKNLTDERNRIEHQCSALSDDALRRLAADVFLIIHKFTSDELQLVPVNFFGEETWKILLDNKEVYDAERTRCLHAQEKVKWPSNELFEAVKDYACSYCASSLLYPVDAASEIQDLVLECHFCGHCLDTKEFAEKALRKRHPHDVYREKDGEEDPLESCPECRMKTYLVLQKLCAMCGYELDYLNCLRCNEFLTLDEQHLDGLCSYCDHVRDKMSNED